MAQTNRTEDGYFYKNLLLPFVVLLLLVGVSTFFFNSAAQSYAHNDPSIEALLGTTACRTSASILATVCFVVFIVLSARKQIRSWFAPLILFFVAGQTLLLFLPTPVIKAELAPSADLTFYLNTLLANWQGFLTFFLLSVVKPGLLTVVVWGVINQITKLSEGMKYYIPLAIFSGLLLTPPSFFGTALGTSRLLILGSIVSLIATLFVFRSVCKKLPLERWEEDPQEKPEPSTIFTPVIFGFAFGAFTLMSTLMRTFIKALPKDGTPAWFSNYPLIIGIGVLTLTIPVAYLGYWLLKKKGWQLAVLTPPLIVSQSIALSYVLHLLNIFTAEFIVINQVLLATLSSAFLFPVLQIGYLSLPKANRFSTKAWAEIIIVPLIAGSGSFIVQSLLIAFGTLKAATVYLPPITIGVAIAMSMLIGIIGKRKLLSHQKDSLRQI